MARLHLLREGTGEARVANSFDVSTERVRNEYGTSAVTWTAGMPTFNPDSGPANPVSNPKVAVIELLHHESAFGTFRSLGFNILKNVNAMEANWKLVEQSRS